MCAFVSHAETVVHLLCVIRIFAELCTSYAQWNEVGARFDVQN